MKDYTFLIHSTPTLSHSVNSGRAGTGWSPINMQTGLVSSGPWVNFKFLGQRCVHKCSVFYSKVNLMIRQARINLYETVVYFSVPRASLNLHTSYLCTSLTESISLNLLMHFKSTVMKWSRWMKTKMKTTWSNQVQLLSFHTRHQRDMQAIHRR